jgi:hypothetical protein
MKTTIGTFYTICFLSFIANPLHAQETEVKALNDAFNFFAAYNNGKVDSLPRNAANYYKVVSQLDNAFKAFILHEKSQDYEKFVLAQRHTNFKLFRLENGMEIDAVSFLVDSVAYVVFGYKTQDRPNYFIKRLEDNKIVFDGNAQAYRVDGMYAVEKNRILLIEEYGNFNSSRKASVIAAEGKAWKQLKAFKGLAFGQVAFQYTNKKFVDKRIYFQLKCEMEALMTLSEDANQISFNEKTKVLSYKQYDNNRRFKKTEAKYENGLFIIDDYNVGDNISSSSPAMPR